jgi:hypothetical protein
MSPARVPSLSLLEETTQERDRLHRRLYGLRRDLFLFANELLEARTRKGISKVDAELVIQRLSDLLERHAH